MKYVRWIVLGTFFLSAAWLLIWGPRPVRARPADHVIIRYWEKWAGHEEEQMRAIVNDFNNTVGKEKKIYVEYLSMTNVNQKTLAATAAGVPPEVAGMWDGQVAQWAALDALEPLDQLAKEFGITEKHYKPVYWKGCTYEGKLYAMVSTPSTIALHYNKRMFERKADALRAAGCDPTRPPRTIEELDRYAAALDERDEKGNLKVAGYLPAEPGWYRLQTPLFFGGHFYDADRRKFTLTSPEAVRSFEWWQSYSRRLGKDAVRDFRAGFGNFNSAQNAFLAEKVAMILQGPWMANFIQFNRPEWNYPALAKLDPKSAEFRQKMEEYYRLSPQERRDVAAWGVAPFPSIYGDTLKGDDLVDKAVSWAGFDALIIPRGAKHQREAFEFIAYVNRQDVMEKLCATQCKNTPLAAAPLESWHQNHVNPYIETFDRLASSPRVDRLPPLPVWPEVESDYGAAIDRITLMLQTPEESLRQAEKRMQKKLDMFMEDQAIRRERGK